MDTEHATARYRSRILREMNANRDNPFHSPPSSTGSHGSMSPTLSSVFSDPEGESTRKLNEDIARITGNRKLPVNWEAAQRKWPDFFGHSKLTTGNALLDNDTDTRPLSAQSKENKPPHGYHDDESTRETWLDSKRTRAEMQPRVDNESELSSMAAAKSHVRGFSKPELSRDQRHPSPLAKVRNRVPSLPGLHSERRVSEALDQLRRASASPRNRQRRTSHEQDSPFANSAKSSLTAVQSPPRFEDHQPDNQTFDASHVRSFFMPDVSHLGDFVTGTLRFSGSNKNGVPIFVKHGRVHDSNQREPAQAYAEVDGLDVPEEEEQIFVSMDMIRQEIISLQEHYDKVQEYAEDLQRQVEKMEAELKTRKTSGLGDSGYLNEQVMAQKNRLEVEVSTLQSRVEQLSRKISLSEMDNESATKERDRAVQRLQEACEDISKLTRQLSQREHEVEKLRRQLDSTENTRGENDTLRRDMISLKHGRDALELENNSLRQENESLRKQQQEKRLGSSLQGETANVRHENEVLISENRSLRSHNQALMGENKDLREQCDTAQQELQVAQEEADALRQDVEIISEEKSTLQEDNGSLVRHNEKYFNENKMLRRENSGFERSIHDLHDENVKLKDEVELLKQQLDHCRPIPKEDFSARLNEQTEEDMTSAFFIPDITMKTNPTEPDATETREMPPPPELTAQSAFTEDTRTNRRDMAWQGQRETARQRSKSRNRAQGKASLQSQKVAFSIPGKEDTKMSNKANRGSKRASSALKKTIMSPYDDLDDTTGLQSLDNATDDQAVHLNLPIQPSRERETQDMTYQSQKSATRHTDNAAFLSSKDTCPGLSPSARRVLDTLCEHNCKNCTVCSRIASHRSLFSSQETRSGKKRISVPRPIPVTDRDLTGEDLTSRPAKPPGHALALVIKACEDEARHLQFELANLQAHYAEVDMALGRRERIAMATQLKDLLRKIEAKNDMVYSLYDVLEGQKAAGQAMSEEEIELTVLEITGMKLEEVTGEITWEGVPEV